MLERVIRAVWALPGVTAADWIDGLPLNGTGGAFRDVWTGTENGLTSGLLPVRSSPTPSARTISRPSACACSRAASSGRAIRRGLMAWP
ncbi:MAG: hypothetical protein R2882_01085 [Gemmatimonadales bacterium]